MSHWEYKVITSGKGGFASPALMEKFLNDLGKEEWEILSFHTQPDNPLAFHGLARRGTQREWTLEDAAAAAKVEADKVRAEFAAKFAGMTPAESEKPEPAGGTEADDGLRRLRDTDRDNDPEALAEEAAEEDKKPGDWDEWPEEDDLPTFFEAVKPHLRRNQRGPGQSVALDYLAKRWDQREADIVGALEECTLTVPESEDTPPEYFEFDGDLYWLNRNQRGQLFLNVREKPRPVFRTAPAKNHDPSDPAAQELMAEAAAEDARKKQQLEAQQEKERRRQEEREARQAAAAARQQQNQQNQSAQSQNAAGGAEGTPAADVPAGPLPTGPELLDKLRPHMRRNRRGPGISGSTGYLAKAMRQPEADLVAALAVLGLVPAEQGNAKPEPVEIGGFAYWLNKDGRGGIWINGRERREGDGGKDGSQGDSPAEPSAPASETTEAPLADNPAPASAAAVTVPSEPAPVSDAPVSAGPLAAVRLLLKPNKRGAGASGELGFLARTLGQADEALVTSLTAAGLAVPADSEDKPVFVELGDEILWINRNAKDGSLWLNAKAKAARKGRSGGRNKKAAESDEATDSEA